MSNIEDLVKSTDMRMHLSEEKVQRSLKEIYHGVLSNVDHKLDKLRYTSANLELKVKYFNYNAFGIF